MKRIHILFALIQFSCVVMLLLMATNCIPKGFFATEKSQQVEYYLNIACIVQTLVAVPLVVHRLQQHPVVRFVVLFTVIIFALLCYQFTLTTTGLFCAAIAYLTLWYVYATTVRRHRQL